MSSGYMSTAAYIPIACLYSLFSENKKSPFPLLLEPVVERRICVKEDSVNQVLVASNLVEYVVSIFMV
jgi:hypothetical protein